MSFRRFIKNIRKIIGFTFIRPVQRFNVVNRAQKYLGPDAKYFMPAPRAIGPMFKQAKGAIQYPHLVERKGFKSVQQRRLEALEKEKSTLRDQDVTEAEKFVVKVSSRLEVTKTVVNEQASRLLPPSSGLNQIGSKTELSPSVDNKKIDRPLPTMRSLEMSDPASIWVVEKTPSGRLNLDQLQEIMLNKIDDPDNYWTPERLADKYKIKAEYAESLCKHLKHIIIHLPPKMAKLLEYTGRNDEVYQASKHLVYVVDNELRSEEDKKYDGMYLAEDKLDDEVKQVIGEIRNKDEESIEALRANFNRLERSVEPLRIKPLNVVPLETQNLIDQPSPRQRNNKHSEGPSGSAVNRIT